MSPRAGTPKEIPETVYGPWDYTGYTNPFPYDDTLSYPLLGDWVSDRGRVEDWGCGTAWMKNFVRGGPYVGLDGAWSKWSDQVVDLRTYRSDTPCAVMRHVLEHNHDWRDIARNFTDSWHDRAGIAFFIPPQLEDDDMGFEDWPVPDLAISAPDLLEILSAHGTKFVDWVVDYPSSRPIQYEWEGILLMER